MAVPPPRILNARNVLPALRAAELGWVSSRAAKKAVAEAEALAVKGQMADALEILAKKCRLSDEVLRSITRDESRRRRWWAFWWRRTGWLGAWNAPTKSLLKSLYHMHRGGFNGEQSMRAEEELNNRAFAGPQHLREVLDAMRAFKPRPGIMPDPIGHLVRGWVRRGLEMPDDVLEELGNRQ